jgi:hypothetical protein
MRRSFLVFCAVLSAAAVLLDSSTSAWAQPTFVGPVPYLSSGDIPAGFYSGSVALEDFEDCSLDLGMTASDGEPISSSGGGGCTPFGSIIDSVDADDGLIDGSGSLGSSWFYFSGSTGITFTFATPVSAAGGVWTDGEGTTTFEAFGPGMVSLGTIGPVMIADGNITGETAEDRFFGVKDSSGIVAIKLSNTSGGIEVDHIQFGGPPPSVPSLTPAGWFLLTTALVMIAGWCANGAARKRRAASSYTDS